MDVGAEVRERGAGDGLGGEVGGEARGEGVGLDAEGGEADSVDGDAVAGVEAAVSVGAAMVMRVAPAVGVTARRVPVVSMRPVNMSIRVQSWLSGVRVRLVRARGRGGSR